MKIKKGQTVYFYKSTGQYEGTILSGTVVAITKDLVSGKVTYTIKTAAVDGEWAWFSNRDYTLEADQIYTSSKQIEKEYKEEIVYGKLSKKLDNLDTLLNKVFNEVKEPIVKENWQSLTISGLKEFSSKLQVNAEDVVIGEMSLKAEINKLKKDIASIKKQIKPKTKKPVVEKKSVAEKKSEDK